jgi:hypothetical protein
MDVYYTWPAYYVIRGQYKLISISIPETIIFVILLLFAIFRVIPWIPPRISAYGLIPYHILLSVGWIISWLLSYTKNSLAHAIGFVYRLFVLIFNGLGLAFIITQLVECWTGVLPMDCRNTQFVDIIVMILSLVLFILSLVVIVHIIAIIRRTGSAKPRGLNYDYLN